MHVSVSVLNSIIVLVVSLAFVLAAPPALANDSQGVRHNLEVTLNPDEGTLIVSDRLHFSKPVQKQLLFRLNKGLEVSSPHGRLEQLSNSGNGITHGYRLILDESRDEIALEIHGKLQVPQFRGMGGMPIADISATGVYMDSASAWYPVTNNHIEGFELSVSLPAQWESISQGKRSLHDTGQRWTSKTPEQEIYLVAGPYTRYARKHGIIDLSVYLLSPDRRLADTYLSYTGAYIDRYSTLIGDYPFPKFAVVENRWQTGYGMPSFTLLGSRVIRLPFIPRTSLPHEILHNWWGNGVWVDYDRGNWSEGLTAYLADHLMKELDSQGNDYRRKALERYADYAAEKRDFPLSQFVARHNDASQAIGYSKSLMLFHMLRRHHGDRVFKQGLKQLWQKRRFRETGFEEVLEIFDRVAAQKNDIARQWLVREGAPVIHIKDAEVTQVDEKYRLTITLKQAQDSAPFELSVPVAVSLEDREVAIVRDVSLTGRETRVEFDYGQKPLRQDIDPTFDVMRLLDDSERPPTLGQLLGSERWIIVLPSAAPAAEQQAWRTLASAWKRRYPDLVIMDDSDTGAIPDNTDLLIAGDSNGQMSDHLAEMATNNPAGSHLLVEHRDDRVVGYLRAGDPATIPLLARKLPHYGSYGRLAFDADGRNLVKQSADVEASILTRHFTEERVQLRLPDALPLTRVR